MLNSIWRSQHTIAITTESPRATHIAIAAGILVILSLSTFGCSGKPQYYSAGKATLETPTTLAILPLVNLTRYDQAQDIVMNSLVVELLKRGTFEVMDPGLVDTVVLKKRLRLTDRLSLKALQTLGAELAVKYVLVGAVNEFNIVNSHVGTLPTVSISLRMIHCADGKVVWAATHTKRGDDAETVFGFGRVATLEKLTAVAVKEMTDTIKQ